MSILIGPQATYADPKEGSIMAAESLATATRPTDIGLKREMGLAGAIWSSETSLIGSGWLFGSLFAARFSLAPRPW